MVEEINLTSMANKKVRCDKCKREYNAHSLTMIKEVNLCYYCKNGYKPPRFKKK